MIKQTISDKKFKFFNDKEKSDYVYYTYDDLIKLIKLQFIKIIRECNIDEKLRADNFIKSWYPDLNWKNKHVGMSDKNLEINAKIESLFLETLRILDIDNKLPDEEKYVSKKYNMSIDEKLFEKHLIEPNLWNKLDDYSRFAIDSYPPYDTPDYEYFPSWLHYQNNFIYIFIEKLMFYWGDKLELPEELNPILPHSNTLKMNNPDFSMNNPDFKSYIFYKDKEKTDAFSIYYMDLVKSMKNIFLTQLKDLKIDNELSVEYNLKLTLYAKYVKNNPKIIKSDINVVNFKKLEPLYIETLRTLDIYNTLSAAEKYEPKKYNDQNMSLTEKLLEKKLIEPNLWNRFDDFSKLALEKYDFETFNYDFQFLIFTDNFFDQFTTHFMFYWGDGLALSEELNPIRPYLSIRKLFLPKK